VQPQWSEFWEPFQWLGFVARIHADGVPDLVHFTVSSGSPCLSAGSSPPSSAWCSGRHPAAPGRLSRHRHPGLRRDRAQSSRATTPYLTNGAIGLNGAAPPRLFGYSFGVASSPYYYLGLLMIGVLVFVSLAAAEFAGGACLDGDPRG